MENRNGYAICYNEWIFDEQIKSELGLLLLISSLCAEKGYCWASNEYFSELFKVDTVTISRKIKKLEKLKHLTITYKKQGFHVTLREIRLTKMLTVDIQKNQSSINKNVNRSINKNVKENNTSNNNIINNKELFEKWWNLYDRKVGKTDALNKWMKLSNQERNKCLEVVNDYVKSTPNPLFRKHPKTYLNNKAWEDEIIFKQESQTVTKTAKGNMYNTKELFKGI